MGWCLEANRAGCHVYGRSQRAVRGWSVQEAGAGSARARIVNRRIWIK